MPGLRALMEAVRWQESSDDYQQDGNPNFKGAYQFGTAAFIVTGYKNEDGSWTGKNGIKSMDDWLAEITENPDIERIQDGAFLEWMMYLWSKIRAEDAEPLAGQTLNGVALSVSGMILGSHLIGETAFQDTYIVSGGTNVITDGDGTTGKPVTDYIEQFGGYDLTDLTGIDPAIIPAGFADYFVTNHDLANTFNRHSDDNIDLIGNSNTNDYPMHMGTGDDVINGFGGSDTVYGASGGHDILDGGTNELNNGDLLSYAEYEGSVTITLLAPRDGPEPPAFQATGSGGWTDSFVNFERLDLTAQADSVDLEAPTEQEMEYEGILILAGSGNDTIKSGAAGDTITGNAGSDELRGNGGDDVIIFDAEDTVVDGGEGRDVGVFQGDGAVDMDLSAHGLEVLIAGNGADILRLGSGQMAAGGDGDDQFSVQLSGDGPAIVWGGGGNDSYQFLSSETAAVGGVMFVNVTGLTAENFAEFHLDQLGFGSDFDWSKVSAVILNGEDGEEILDGEYVMGSGQVTDAIYAATEVNSGGYATAPENEYEILSWTNDTITQSLNGESVDVLYTQMSNFTDGARSLDVQHFGAKFYESSTHRVVYMIYEGERTFHSFDGFEVPPGGVTIGDWISEIGETAEYLWIANVIDEVPEGETAIYQFEMEVYVWTTLVLPVEAESFDDVEGLFFVGGAMTENGIDVNGQIMVTMPVGETPGWMA